MRQYIFWHHALDDLEGAQPSSLLLRSPEVQKNLPEQGGGGSSPSSGLSCLSPDLLLSAAVRRPPAPELVGASLTMTCPHLHSTDLPNILHNRDNRSLGRIAVTGACGQRART